ncbi:Domain found in IF2B/IF5 [Pelomyxa schiedti]|nr:Domain found in IF2B/IF5 [Pelomyxa schiedti]
MPRKNKRARGGATNAVVVTARSNPPTACATATTSSHVVEATATSTSRFLRVPILRSCCGSTDANERYTMPRMIVENSSRSGGTTRITNLDDVAKALNRNAEDLCAYFVFQLKTSRAQPNTTEIRGTFTLSVLETHLANYIAHFVACSVCNNPETELMVNDTGKVHLLCAACGNKSPVEGPRKMLDYIVERSSSGYQLTHRSYTSHLVVGTAAPEVLNEIERAADEADQNNTNKPSKSTTKKTAKKAKKPSSEEDDEDWAVDVSPEAVEARRKQFMGDIPTSASSHFF